MIKLGIVGSRDKYWEEVDAVDDGRNFVNQYIWKRRNLCEFVSGASPGGGVDQWVKYFCETRGLHYKEFPPKKNTTKEYFARNTQIAEYVDILVAFCAGKVTSGTHDTIRKAIMRNKYVIVYVFYDGKWSKTEYNKPNDLLDYLAKRNENNT